MPPMTPPAMGPAGEEVLDVGVSPFIGTHIVFAQALQPPPIKAHCSPFEQLGHGGGCGGQFAHRLNRVGLEKSGSAEELVPMALVS